MDLKLSRLFKGNDYTIGKLYINGEYFCDTLEDMDRRLNQTDDLSVIYSLKVYGKTAIPKGTYKITLDVVSPKFSAPKYADSYGNIQGKLPRLLDVPGFEGILIHIGNSHTDTDGCILVGENKVKGKVINSTNTFNALYAKLKLAENITITIE